MVEATNTTMTTGGAAAEVKDDTTAVVEAVKEPTGGDFAAGGRDLHLCIVGVDKHWIEKDLIKFLRKSFSQKKAAAENNEEAKGDDDIPLKGVAKKRGK